MKSIRTVLICVVAGFFSSAALAQTYPTKPIRLLIPFGPGGAADIIGRLIAPGLAEGVKQQVVVDNRQGGGTIIATELLANAAADGYTLMLANISFGANPGLHKKLPYDTLRDFVPIVIVDFLPNILLVHPSVPAKSVGELIALAKSKPGSLNYASAGVGSSNHLNTELFNKDTGVQTVHVPYQSGGQVITALLGPQVHFAFISVPPAVAHVKAGRLRILAVTSATRMPSFPDAPTIAESAVPGFAFNEWHIMLAPKGTPKEVIARLNSEINRTLTVPDVKERFATLGAEVRGGKPEEAAAYLKNEVSRWMKVLTPVN